MMEVAEDKEQKMERIRRYARKAVIMDLRTTLNVHPECDMFSLSYAIRLAATLLDTIG